MGDPLQPINDLIDEVTVDVKRIANQRDTYREALDEIGAAIAQISVNGVTATVERIEEIRQEARRARW